MKYFIIKLYLLGQLAFRMESGRAQEFVLPLQSQVGLKEQKSTLFKKKRSTLPFFDDFSYPGPYPDPSLWTDQQAYINNSMTDATVSRGVATLDALNQFGRPYVNDQFSIKLADSLTCQPIDLSTYNTQSQIFLSFFYQPQGLGFAPETSDSLLLYFKNNLGNWFKVWEQRGTNYQPMKTVILSVSDTQYLHNTFQFRFVNIASPNINDDTWHIDYVKLDAGRNPSDTLVNDLCFTLEPSSILKPYTSMPYRHFTVNASAELSTGQDLQIRNHYYTPQNMQLTHEAREVNSGTLINSGALPSAVVTPQTVLGLSIPSYPINFTAPGPYSQVKIRNKYYFNSIGPTDVKRNDTIVRETVFDNYFAYDDGSAEKSYFLYPALNYPSKTALKFKLNVADTLRGLAIHFGSQVPSAANKYFSIVVYKHLGDLSSADTILRQQDLYQVMYEPDINGFTTYAFNQPLALEAGNYYIGITQPANFGSDSIYYGLDVNTNANLQYLFYNVDGTWYASGAQGTVMMRPLVGQVFNPSQVDDWAEEISLSWCYPNPFQNEIHIKGMTRNNAYELYNLSGQCVQKGRLNQERISFNHLIPGTYILYLENDEGRVQKQKIVKRP